MTTQDIVKMRLYNQRLTGPKFKTPEEVVRYFGAMQAQDYPSALWAIGNRLAKPSIAVVEKAIAEGKIIRTWPMRGTIHFIPPEDARWMLDLMTPPVLRGYVRRHAYMGINDNIIARCRDILVKALKKSKHLTRPEIYKLWEDAKISTKNSLGLHILGRLAHDQVVCFGIRNGKLPTFTLFNEWVPEGKKLTREESLRELAIRYFTSHGPAQIQDLSWWSGLPMRDVRQGIELAGQKLEKLEVEGKVYWIGYRPSVERPVGSPVGRGSTEASKPNVFLLPSFDEYVVGYKDRTAVLHETHNRHMDPARNGIFKPIVVINGQVVGSWKKEIKKSEVGITYNPFTKFTVPEEKAIKEASESCKNFWKNEQAKDQ